MHDSINKLTPTVKHYIIRPNCSMNWIVTIRLLGLIAIVMALIAIGFLILGLWLVLPFLRTRADFYNNGILYRCTQA